jgi:hypothetical protein
VRVTAAANTRLRFTHGPDLRRAELPAPAEDDVSAAFFRLAPGPAASAPHFEPILKVEAEPLKGAVRVRPAYKLMLTETGWRVRAELQVTPIRREVDSITVEVPAAWPRAIQADPPKLVEGVQQDDPKAPDALWRPVTIRLAGAYRQPFDLVLTTTLGVPPGAREATIPLIRFPDGVEADTTVTATVLPGLEVRGSVREWDAGVAQPLSAVPGPDGKLPKAVAAVQAKADHGFSRVDLAWQPYRPDMTADIRAEVTVGERQAVVTQRVRLRSPDGFGRPVRFHGPAGVPLDPAGPGEWSFTPPADARDTATLTVTYPVTLPVRPADGGPWRATVPLLWPVGATRTEGVVRVWSNTGRAIGAEPGPWRELPPEPVPERDALPAVTLAGSGSDLPLILELRDPADPAAVAVWGERGLIQAWTADDGSVTCRARFLLKRWLIDSVELRLPAPVSATEIFVDDPPRKVTADTVADPAGGSDRVVTVKLPAAKPGRTVVLEVRYQLAAGRPGDGALYPAPRPRAAFSGPVRWQITVPSGSVPLILGDGLAAEQRWRLRSGMFVPGPAASTEELDRWFRTGTEPEGDGSGAAESVVVRQSGSGAVRVYHVPMVGLAVGCSVAVLLLGLVVSRLPGSVGGPAVALLAGAAAVGAVLFPQPAGQIAGAAQPGFAALLLVLAVQVAARWHYHRRVTHLPGFTRTRPEPVVVPAAPSSDRAGQNGTTGALGPLPSVREPRPTTSGS